MSPWTDLALLGDSLTTRSKHDPLLTPAALEGARQYYLGQLDPADPQASPLYGDFSALPPVMLHVGEDEILLDDAQRYADRTQKAGSVAVPHVWKGMVHVFSCKPRLAACRTQGTRQYRRIPSLPSWPLSTFSR
jgi:monoterpene epsilon-lactone hydrolase